MMRILHTMKRMKRSSKLFLMALACVGAALAVQPAAAEAQVVENVDGVSCFHGYFNYPVWQTGTRLGAAFDVSSAFIAAEDDVYEYIKVNDLIVHYDADLLTLDDVRLIRYNKRTGQFAFQDPDGGWVSPYRTFGYTSDLNNALYLLRAKFGI